MKKKRKIWFSKIWNKNMTPELFFRAIPGILEEYEFVLTKEDPDVIITASPKPFKSRAIKIFYTMENVVPSMKSFDYAFAFAYEKKINNKNYTRMPNYVRLGAGVDLVKKDINYDELMIHKNKFCAFIYFNFKGTHRNRFFTKLSQYKKVDAPGRVGNNMRSIAQINGLKGHKFRNRRYDQKIQFLRNYRFCIAFENDSAPGYTTEKIYHAMLAGCIPIYWGNPFIHKDFNPKSFINVHAYKSFNAVVAEIQRIENNPRVYIDYLKQPWYHKNKPSKYTNADRVYKRWVRALDGRE